MHHASLHGASSVAEETNDVTDAKYRGRHRARRSTGLSPRIVGTGLVLPTTATLAVVSMTGTAPMALTSAAAVPSPAAADDGPADQAELAQDKANDSATLARGVQDRIARDNNRVRLDAVTAENAKRAAAEAALETTTPLRVTVAAPGATSTVAVKSAVNAPVLGNKGWVNPLTVAYRLTSPFGWRWGKIHTGQDMACPVGSPVRAIADGVVIFAGWDWAFGYKVELRHSDGTVSWYAHNSRLKVSEGDVVATGQVISLSGNTGHSTGPHLHLEIHPKGGNAVPPMSWMAAHGVRL